MEKDPAGVDHRNGYGESRALLAGMEGGDEAEKEADGEDEDAEGDGLVSPIGNEKGQREEETQESLGFVAVDRKVVVGGVEHLGERDEVEENGGDGSGDSDVTPLGAVIKGGGQNRKRGYAVEENRDSEPEEGHKVQVFDDAFRRIDCNC